MGTRIIAKLTYLIGQATLKEQRHVVACVAGWTPLALGIVWLLS